MTNPFKGMQYADRRKNFPSWNDKDSDVYYEWKDVEQADMVFATSTRIRMKPETVYHLHVAGNSQVFYNKDTLMSAVASHVVKDQEIRIVPGVSPLATISVPKLQMKRYGVDSGDWTDIKVGSSPIVLNYATVFRIRPDYYHVVDSIDPINRGSVAFYDIDKLANYVNNRIRTNGLDFSVKKVKYDS